MPSLSMVSRWGYRVPKNSLLFSSLYYSFRVAHFSDSKSSPPPFSVWSSSSSEAISSSGEAISSSESSSISSNLLPTGFFPRVISALFLKNSLAEDLLDLRDRVFPAGELKVSSSLITSSSWLDSLWSILKLACSLLLDPKGDGSEGPLAAACEEGVGYLLNGERALFRILDKGERLFIIKNKGGRNSKPKFSRLGDWMMEETNEFVKSFW